MGEPEPLEDVMRKIAALIAVLAIALLPMIGSVTSLLIQTVETKVGHYPLISLETIQLKMNMEADELVYAQACKRNRAAMLELYQLDDCVLDTTGSQRELEDDLCRKDNGCNDTERPCAVCEELARLAPLPPTCEQQLARARWENIESHRDMKAAIAKRKMHARQLDAGWVRSALLGTTRYTHNVWLCTDDPYANFDYETETTFFWKTY